MAEPALDNLEQRLAAFENATGRLQRTLAAQAVVADPVPFGHGSSSARRLALAIKEPADNDLPSGLRPSVPSVAPVTGALTARRRAEGASAAAQPGFTSAFGKPSIPVLAAPLPAPAMAAEPAPTPAEPGSARRARPAKPWWRRTRVVLLAAAALLVALLVGLPRLFPVLPDAAVWAETKSCPAPASGMIIDLLVQVGDAVTAGQPMARIQDAAMTTTTLTAPSDCVVARLLVTAGARVLSGELVAELALPASQRVVVTLPATAAAALGDRVSVMLLGERRLVSGTIELVLGANAPGPWTGNGTPPRRGLILLDPSPRPPLLGQGAQVTVLGREPGPFRLALLALRRSLPW